ncbi:MAG: ABC transporter substrate-binding protein [Aminivibrio sp.]|jgi:peptide/nickel transport system substrate-binding protein
MKRMKPVLMLVLCLLLIAGAAAGAEKGGVLRVAVIDEAPTLDQHVVTSDLTTMIAQHVFEGLYTFDSKYGPVPLLVESEEMKDGGKTAVLKIREGVKFHNGKELDAQDVVSSLIRWSRHGARGPVLFDNLEKVEATGKHEVTFFFKAPFAPWKNLLAFMNGGPVVYLHDVMAEADQTPITPENYIGTGPYKFAERNPGRYIKLVRYDDYASRTEPADGYAGKREALFDEIRFIPVPDVGTRVNGVKAGDYDYAEQILGDLFDSLKDDSSVVTTVNQGANQGMMFFNSKEGVLKDNFKLRQALQAAVDMEPAMQAAIGPKELWKASGSFMPESTLWYSKAGLDKFSAGDAELAKKLAAEAGYKGEKITFMASTAYKFHYDATLVIVQQMKEAGFNIDHQIYDWATLISKRGDPGQWDIFFTHHGFVPDPILYTFMSESYPGWWVTDTRKALAADFATTLDEGKRKEVWDKIQALVYDEVPVMKTGDHFTYDIYSPKVQGLSASSLIWPKFWGVSFGK